MRAGFRFSFMRQLGCDVESGVAIEAEPEEAVEGNDHTYGMAMLFFAYDEHYTYVSLGENPPRGDIFEASPPYVSFRFHAILCVLERSGRMLLPKKGTFLCQYLFYCKEQG